MKQEQNNNSSIGGLPKNLLMLIFSNLDLVSLINAAQVNKQWKTFLESDYTWKVIYQCPHHQKTLYHGKLWKNLLQQAGNENANIEIVLTSYLKQVFALDLPQNETPVTFFTKCVSYFLGSEKRVDIGEKWFFTSRQFKNYEVCENYLKPWTANSILVNIKRIFLQVQQLSQVGKVQSQGFVLEKLTHETQDYQLIVKALLQLRQLEQMLTAVIILYKYECEEDNNRQLAILTDKNWSHLLTFRGLLALEAHDATLNPSARYEEVFVFDLPEETRKKHSFSAEKNITKEQRTYFEYLKKWGSEAKEKELLQGFEGINGSNHYLLLVEPHFIARLSDKTVLQLALNANTNIEFLFESPAFVQRLKLILLAEKENPTQILLGLIENKIVFSGEKLESKEWKERYSAQFSRGILLNSSLTQFIANENILLILEKMNGISFEKLGSILSSNVDLACRLTKDYFFLKKFAVAAKCSYLDIIQHPAVMKTITAGTAYQLALADIDLAIILLENEQTGKLFDLQQLQGVKKQYPLSNQNTQQKKIGSLHFLIIQREKEATKRAKEKLEREEKELEHKKTPELLKLALSESPLAKAAAGWLNARKGLEDQLSEEALFQLFNHYYRSNLPQNLSNNSEVLFVKQVRLVLAKKSTEELRLLMLDEKAPAIAYLAAETYANKTSELNINDFEISVFIKLLTQYEKLFPNASNILTLLRCDFNPSIEQEEIVKRIESLSSYDNQLVPVLKANEDFAKRVARNSSLLLVIAEKFKVSIIELIQQPFLIKHLNGDTVCGLALSDLEIAKAILENNELSALFEPKHFQVLEEKYSEQDKKQVGNLLQQLVQRENEWLEKQSLENLLKWALAKNENLWLAEIAAIYLSKQEEIISKLPEQDQIDLFNAHNSYDKKIKYAGNEELLFLKSVTNILNEKTNAELFTFVLDKNKPAMSRLAMELLLARKVDLNFSVEPKLVELIASHLQVPLFSEHFAELINAPVFQQAFFSAILSLPFQTDKKSQQDIYTVLTEERYANFLMQDDNLIQHLMWKELGHLPSHGMEIVKKKAMQQEKNEPITSKLTKEELLELEKKAAVYLQNKRFREYGRVAWLLCAGNASLDELGSAIEWAIEAKRHVDQPPRGVPRIATLVDQLGLLPPTYVHVRNRIINDIQNKQFEKEGKNQGTELLKKYQKECEQLIKQDEDVTKKQKEADKVIVEKYGAHCEELQKKADQYAPDKKNTNPEKYRLYSKRSVAMRNLCADTLKTSNKLFAQDFSNSDTSYNGEAVFNQLEQTINKHLEGNFILNLWGQKPDVNKEISPGNVYLYKEQKEQAKQNEAVVVKAMIVDYAGFPEEITIDDQIKGAQECLEKLPWKPKENVVNARDEASLNFLQILQSNGKIPRKDNCLREHTGSKQVIYDGLSVLSWLLIPYMIYKRVTTGTFFYFHANNGTEDALQKGKPELRQALTHS